MRPVVGRDLAAQQVEIDRPALGLVELVQRDVGAGGSRHLVQALVAGPGHDDVVARPAQHVHQAEDRFLGAGEGQDLVGVDRLVQRGDLASEQRMPVRFGVAELEPVPQRPGLVVRQREQLGHRERLDVRGAQEVLRRRTPSARNSARGRSRRCASTHDGAPCRPWLGPSSSSACRRRSAAICPGWSARRPGCASSGWWRRCARDRCLDGAEIHDAGDLADRPRVRGGRRPAGEEPGPDLRVPAARAGPRGVGGRRRRGRADDPRLFDPRRRLHGPRRRDGRTPARPTPNDAWRSPGSMPTATSTRPTRRRRATSGGCPSRCCAGAASRTSSAPPTARASTKRTPRSSAGRCSTRPSRGRSRRRGSPTSGPGCSGRRPASPRWPAGPPRSGARSTRSTSRSTWIASTRRAAGR